MVLYIDILYLWAIWRITLLIKFEPWSVIQAFGAVYGLINFSTSASAISNDVACSSGTATEYLVSRIWIMSIFLYISISRRQRSHDIHWVLIERGTCCIREDYRLSSFYTNFSNWQIRHSCINFCISIFIPQIKNNYGKSFYMSSLYPYGLQWPKHDFRVLFYFYRMAQE